MSRILLVAEAVTLAHVGRPLALAKILEQLGHEVVFACAAAARRWPEAEGRAWQPVQSVSAERFLRSLARGNVLYDFATLKQYVADDLDLIDRVDPDVVVGDFRLSLYISARLRKRPYGALANAYWSPRYFELGQVPDLPLVAWLGVPTADRIFRATHRAAFRWHARPFARTCRHFGVPPPGSSILDAYTASDLTAFADAEDFYPARTGDSKRAAFIGPLTWAPPVPLPAGHEQWGRSRSLVYVTLGSSGAPQTARRVLDSLADVPVDVVVAGAGARLSTAPRNAVVLDYAPGDVLCGRAALVVGNGGSPVAYQALQAGAPLLGMAGNLDQFLNMKMVERLGAGRCLRARNATVGEIRDAALALIGSADFRRAAERAQAILAAIDRPSRVQTWLLALGA